MKGNSVGWFEIYVENMDRAKKFYQSVFGVTLQKLENPEMEMWSFPGDVNSYGAPGALVKILALKEVISICFKIENYHFRQLGRKL